MSSFIRSSSSKSSYIESDLIKQANDIFNICKDLDNTNAIDDDSIDNAFDNHVDNVLSILNEKLLTIDDDNVKQCEIIRAKHGNSITVIITISIIVNIIIGVFDASFQYIISLLSDNSASNTRDLANSLLVIRSLHTEFLRDMQLVVSKQSNATDTLKNEVTLTTAIILLLLLIIISIFLLLGPNIKRQQSPSTKLH